MKGSDPKWKKRGYNIEILYFRLDKYLHQRFFTTKREPNGALTSHAIASTTGDGFHTYGRVPEHIREAAWAISRAQAKVKAALITLKKIPSWDV